MQIHRQLLMPMSKLALIRLTSAPAATIFIRVLVGAVFLSERIQKLLYAEKVGAGR